MVSSASTVILDEEGRALATELRTVLEQRLTKLLEQWLSRISAALDEGRVLDAVQATHRPPEPSARVPADLAVRLSTMAGESMSADRDEREWCALLDAVVASPVRRTVKPAGLPVSSSEATRAAALRAAGQVPQLARLLGLPIPPPPGPRRAPAQRGR